MKVFKKVLAVLGAIALSATLVFGAGFDGDEIFGVDWINIGQDVAEDIGILFKGNAQNFHIGLDDSADDYCVGVGTALGTTDAYCVDENAVVTAKDGYIKDTVTNVIDTTLTTSDCGTTQFMGTAGMDLTLPALTDGCEIEFIVSAAIASTSMTVKTPSLADTIYGTLSVNNADVDCSAEDIITIVHDGELPGDNFTLISNGTYWFINDSEFATASKLTCSAT
jgi:hypothetical protein